MALGAAMPVEHCGVWHAGRGRAGLGTHLDGRLAPRPPERRHRDMGLLVAMCLPPRPPKRASPGGSPSTPKQPATGVPSKMIVEFKTRAGDKWTSLRHYDSGPWSGGGNPHWAAINVTLRAVKSNAGIGERKKDVEDWPHYPAQWSNARPLGLLFTCTHVCAGHARASHRGQCTRHCRFQVLHQQRRSRPAVEFSNIDEYVAAIKELPDPDPPEAQEEIGEGVPERVTALEAQVAELMKRVQKLEE